MNKKVIIGVIILIGVLAVSVIAINSVNMNNEVVSNTTNVTDSMDKMDMLLRQEALDLIRNDGYPLLEGTNSLNGQKYFDTEEDRINNPNNPYCEDYTLRDNVSMKGQKVFVNESDK